MDLSKRSKAAVRGLADDALVEILSRLPAKPLCRSKCVSKRWRDLIADRLRCRKFPQTLQGFFYGGDDFGRFADLWGRSVPLVDHSFSFLKKRLGTREIFAMGSCNGLILFGHFLNSSVDDNGKIGSTVCNPVTEQWVAVPRSGWSPPTPNPWRDVWDEESEDGDGAKSVSPFLIFEPAASEHFHLIQFYQDFSTEAVEEVHSYSSETGVWSDRTREWRGYGQGGEWEKWDRMKIISGLKSAVLNGALHIVFYHPQREEILIVAVDCNWKKHRIIRWPGEHKFSVASFIGQSRGCLHCISGHLKQEGLVNNCHITELSIWVLEDNDKEDWILKKTVSCMQLFGKVSCRQEDFNVVTIHPDRNLVFFVQGSDQKLISYDMDSKQVRTLHTLVPDYGSVTPYIPYFTELSTLTKKP